MNQDPVIYPDPIGLKIMMFTSFKRGELIYFRPINLGYITDMERDEDGLTYIKFSNSTSTNRSFTIDDLYTICRVHGGQLCVYTHMMGDVVRHVIFSHNEGDEMPAFETAGMIDMVDIFNILLKYSLLSDSKKCEYMCKI